MYCAALLTQFEQSLGEVLDGGFGPEGSRPTALNH